AGLMPSDRIFVSLGTNLWAFVLPAGMHLVVPVQREVALLDSPHNEIVRFRLIPYSVASGAELSAEQAKKLLLQAYPGAVILDTFSMAANGHRGPAFDAEWEGLGGQTRRARVAFIPSQGGILEFSASGDCRDFGSCQRHLATVMLTFRAADAQGKLSLPILSDKI
ncbi:MAG: hypothetical protein ACREIC_11470, partial [Limisphaerales bacterium]